MTLDIFKEKGTPLDKQRFTWRDLVQAPTSKLDDDAFTRVRIILMNGLESEAIRFSHAMARMMNGDLRLPLAKVRRVEQHQQTMVNWLLPADLSPLETTIGFEQVAIEVTASVAQHEPDPYLAQVYRFGLLEDFDHLYRFSALMDRVMGADANTILQSYTDIMPGRPTVVEHRAPEDDLREHYDSKTAAPLTKLHAADHHGGREPDARLLHDHRADVRRPDRATALRRNRLDRRAARHAVRIDPRSERDAAREVADARGDGGLQLLRLLQYETNPRVKEIWKRFCRLRARTSPLRDGAVQGDREAAIPRNCCRRRFQSLSTTKAIESLFAKH